MYPPTILHVRPGCISLLVYPLTSNLYSPSSVQENIISTAQHTWGPRCLSLCWHVCTDEFMSQLKVCVCCTQHVVPCLCQSRNKSSLTASKVPLITRAAMRQAGPVDGTVCLKLKTTMPRRLWTLSVLHRSCIWIPLSHAPTSDSHLDPMEEEGGGRGEEWHSDYW